MPAPVDSRQYILVRNILDLLFVVVVGIVLEDNPFNLVLDLPKPALFHILQKDLDLRLRAPYNCNI